MGISDHAQKQLGDIVFVELPETNKIVQQGDVFGSVESVKSVSELYTPISGEIIQINSELESNPELINSDAYKTGWIIKIKPSDISELDELMSKEEYERFVQD
ncbi:MAG: glycine cleavage system protein GcvH [Solitalea-like symbiont of Acarus siro]